MNEQRGNFKSNVDFLEKVGFLKDFKKKKVLEVGSGRGVMMQYLQNDLGFDIEGTEVNKGYIEYVKREKGIELKLMNAEKLKYEDNSFDAIISFDVVEHISDLNSHLKEIKRVLKNGGKYFFQTPNKFTNVPFEIVKTKSFYKYKEYHCSLSDYRQLRKRFRNAGFSSELEFIDVKVVNKHFKDKVKKTFGVFGELCLKLKLVKIMDILPKWARTNFYVIARND